MSAATSSNRWWSGKLLPLVFAAGLIILSTVAVLLNTRLAATRVLAQRSTERATQAEASLAKIEKDRVESQRKVDELTTRLKALTLEYERLALQIQVRDNPFRDGTGPSSLQKDAKRARTFALCKDSDNPMCGIDGFDPRVVDMKTAPGLSSSAHK